MKPSQSDFIDIRGLRYHLRRWGPTDAPVMYLLHGLLDVSASMQLMVDAFRQDWNIIAPDWRGCGLSEWPQDGYWFPDYVADLEAVVNHHSGDTPAFFVGHSLGGHVASLYAGIRPARVAKLVILDSLGVPDVPPELAPQRFQRWLKELADPPQNKIYGSFDELAQRIRHRHPKLTAERADFVARCWGQETVPGKVELLGDPKHRLRMPTLYRSAESIAIWKQVTAPVLCVDAGESWLDQMLPAQEKAARRGAFPNLRTEVIPGASHMLHHDHPAETAARVEVFLSTS
ncbi:MAG: alpha/beta fold hydrolase [Nevskiales bacterium]